VLRGKREFSLLTLHIPFRLGTMYLRTQPWRRRTMRPFKGPPPCEEEVKENRPVSYPAPCPVCNGLLIPLRGHYRCARCCYSFCIGCEAEPFCPPVAEE